NLIYKDVSNNFVVLDVATRKVATLFSSKQMAKCLEENRLSADLAGVSGFCSWNGTNYDLYFALQKERNWGESFLLKADHDTRTLKLVDREFKFQWLGHFDPSGSHYVYEGESGGPG